MLTPSQQKLDVSLHQRNHILTLLNDPIRYRQHRPAVSCRQHTPRIVPSYNNQPFVDATQASRIRAMIAFLADANAPTFTPITSDDLVIILDSGCTIAMTPDKGDFITDTYSPQQHTVGGIASGLQTEGVGQVSWKLTDVNGKPVVMTLTAIHVPGLPCRLLPPQQLGATPPQRLGHLPSTMLPNGAWIGGGRAAKVSYNNHIIDFVYDPDTNLPTKKMDLGCTKFCSFIATTTKDNTNLSASQKLLLRLHHRYSHGSMKDIQQWSRDRLYNIPIDVSCCTIPICSACQFGMAKKRTKQTGTIGKGKLNPGDFVSVDTMIAGTPGLIPFTCGRASARRYTSTNLWVDHSSKYLWLDHQEAPNSANALQSKIKFETFAEKYGCTIKHIHSDNGIYTAKSFVDHCDGKRQKHTLCGVGAHHQNGSVERYIGYLTGKARTMLLHSMQHWPIEVSASFWPFAFNYAKCVHNFTRRRGESKSPYELFTNETPPIKPGDFRIFGCPAFVLSKEMQDGKATHKFSKTRSYMGIFVGLSPAHAGSVPLIFNPSTKLVSPQYHVIFDEGFETAASSNTEELQLLIQNQLSKLGSGSSDEWIYSDEFDDDQSRHFFDASWDLLGIEEDLHERKKTVKRTLARAIQKNSVLRKKLGLPRGHEGGQPAGKNSINPATAHSLLPKSKLTSIRRSNQPSLGVTLISPDKHVWQRTNKHKKRKRSLPPEGAVARTKEGTTSSLEGVHTTSSIDKGSLQVSNLPLQDPDTSSVLHTDAEDGIIGLHCNNTHDDSSSLLNPDSSFPAIISQLAANSDPNLRDTINSFASLFAEISDTADDRDTEDDVSFNDICTILDERHVIDDCVTFDGTYGNFIDPFSFAAATKGNNPDILTRSSMLKTEDREEFLKVEEKELKGLEDFGVFEYFPISSIPDHRRRKLLNAIWSYRRKRRPDGTLLKYKSRMCADGSQQQDGIDFSLDDLYSPVVQWSTVRLTLLLASLLGLKSRQIDYIQAFPQAPLDEDVYMRIPDGWHYDKSTEKLQQSDDPRDKDKSHCIKLKRNLYGVRQASKNFFEHISDGLIKEGFTPSFVDPCLWLRKDCMICLYVDDCIIYANNTSLIDTFISNMREQGYLLQDEGDVENFLGVNIKATKSGNFEMTQTGLIQDILNDLGLNLPNCKYAMHSTPATAILHADEHEPPFTEKWIYRSLIGKLNFLALNSRPDIAFAVHQCARWCSNPRSTHGAAVKRIGKYLKTTESKGIIFRPDGNHSLHAMCDADFAGTWCKANTNTRSSALSRTGFVIMYSGVPIVWHSKLQTEIALSTCEAEYIALSQCARAIIPLRRLIENISDIYEPIDELQSLTSIEGTTKILSPLGKSIILEDNAACIAVAKDNKTKHSPRTRHISIKWHHFRDQIEKGWLTVEKVASAQNWSDIFTKPLARIQFEKLRDEMMGWTQVPPNQYPFPINPVYKAAYTTLRKDADFIGQRSKRCKHF